MYIIKKEGGLLLAYEKYADGKGSIRIRYYFREQFLVEGAYYRECDIGRSLRNGRDAR